MKKDVRWYIEWYKGKKDAVVDEVHTYKAQAEISYEESEYLERLEHEIKLIDEFVAVLEDLIKSKKGQKIQEPVYRRKGDHFVPLRIAENEDLG